MPPGHPGGENLWAAAFRLIVREKALDFRPLSVQFKGDVYIAYKKRKYDW